MEVHDILAGLAVLVGLVGIVAPILPGLALQVIAVAVWAFEESRAAGWVILSIVTILALAASVLKYVFPGRQLRDQGIPGWLIVVAVTVAVVGLFAIPVVGAPIGFVLTIYLFERARRGQVQAWPSTKSALKAVATSIGIELTGGFLIAIVFFVGAFRL